MWCSYSHSPRNSHCFAINPFLSEDPPPLTPSDWDSWSRRFPPAQIRLRSRRLRASALSFDANWTSFRVGYERRRYPSTQIGLYSRRYSSTAQTVRHSHRTSRRRTSEGGGCYLHSLIARSRHYSFKKHKYYVVIIAAFALHFYCLTFLRYHVKNAHIHPH